ncbi:protein of unknown function [Streptantibioticus cattleyicolor NRRL 8057 = DSM 46488]|nr:protein of unknown function [Streptantibioticus cattleyicolor NRRL 8057 = DSM 46488]
MLCGPASMRARSPSGSAGNSYATSSGPKQTAQAKTGPSGTRSPHSRQDKATALPKSVERVAGATVSTAMWRGPLSSSSPRRFSPQAGIGTVPTVASLVVRAAEAADGRERREGCRDVNGPFPQSLWMSSVWRRAGRRTAVDQCVFWRDDPGMRWSPALFKTVSDGQDG